MRVQFIHQNFPDQFRHIAAHLSRQPDVEVLAIGRDTAPGLSGIRLLCYRPKRTVAAYTHPYLRSFKDAVLHGQQVFRVMLDLKRKGFCPDVIVAHPGWGETLYAKDAFPSARLIQFCEYYYHARGADAGFDPEFPSTADSAASIRTRNAIHLLNLENCDIGVTPTQWQLSLHPAAYWNKIKVIHEGIDTDLARPDSEATFQLPNGMMLKAGMPVLTYVARNFEPYREFYIFMRALPRISETCPNCHVVFIGGDDVRYRPRPCFAENWKRKLLNKVGVDSAQVPFTGKLPYSKYLKVLQLSRVHVYRTYPLVLSWSFLEAMACGCAIIASKKLPSARVRR
ncbi:MULTISPECIES: glycosyltransferase [unclassified Pseudomonas]|uniref:glycosyltransferase n=1 Tax=unclassified Pseudomonas TaxID=196821 RepID=UPI00131ACA86|nr:MULTISPECIES: glycosyltransferase [unclassified Pseudomonas]